MLATIGGVIKDYRIKKRISQLELSLRIGWTDSTRLSKIEQGRAGTPSRETIDKIIAALELTKSEKGEFLHIGGYVPTRDEIKNVLDTFKHKIDRWPYAAEIIDFSWRVLYSNDSAKELYNLPKMPSKKKVGNYTHLFDTLFIDSGKEIFKGDDESSLQPRVQELISQFKAENLGWENHKWYKDIILKYSRDKRFLDIWNDIRVEDYKRRFLEYEYMLIKYPNGKEKRYHIIVSELLFDKRFIFIFYLPVRPNEIL
jgi:transcriptional regulator with XRE-family HTH domain